MVLRYKKARSFLHIYCELHPETVTATLEMKLYVLRDTTSCSQRPLGLLG